MEKTAQRPTFAEIDLSILRSNLRSAKDFIGPDLKYMAVVKADAYGHGAVECSRALEQEGIDWLGVATIEEGVELRNEGINAPILCFGSFYEGQELELLENRITPIVFDVSRAAVLDQAAAASGVKVNVHIKIDTGMGRVGVRWDELSEYVKELSQFRNLSVEGIMTHFASADDPAKNSFTNLQIARFYESEKIVRDAGYSPVLIDLANSPGAVAYPGSRGNMVRLGGILYGLGHDIIPPEIAQPQFRPVMSLISQIAYLKSVPAGETIGYGRTFTTKRESVIATIPIGYHDGYRRDFSNRGRVIINNTYAPVIGRVSMDWTIVDVTDIRNAAVGSEAILIGASGDCRVTAEDLANLNGTISYEITCGIGKRVPRRYKR